MGSKYWNISMNYQGGCSPCAEGCTHCWAADCASKRLANHPLYKGLTKNGKWTGEIRVMPEYIKVIGGKPKTIFWCNMSDMFHEKARFEDIDIAFGAMFAMPQHTHLILTKRVKRMAEYIPHLDDKCYECGDPICWSDKPNPNIHLGITICTQKEADEILPIALQIPGFDWVSAEPLLGPIDFQNVDWDGATGLCTLDNPPWQIRQIVVGAESGSKRRPCKLEWIKSIVEQCKAASVKCFVKQILLPEGNCMKSKNTVVSHNPAEWPEWARVRNEI